MPARRGAVATDRRPLRNGSARQGRLGNGGKRDRPTAPALAGTPAPARSGSQAGRLRVHFLFSTARKLEANWPAARANTTCNRHGPVPDSAICWGAGKASQGVGRAAHALRPKPSRPGSRYPPCALGIPTLKNQPQSRKAARAQRAGTPSHRRTGRALDAETACDGPSALSPRISGDAQRRPLRAVVGRMTSSQTGLMFWFIRKKFVGSYFFLSSTSRLYVAP